MDDATLLAAIAGGDDEAMRTLFDRHAPWVAVRLQRLLPAHAVEDVMQETFVAVWRGSNRFGGDSEPPAWIWGIARRQAALWLRKAGRTALSLDAEAWRDGVRSSDTSDDAIHRVDIDRALAALSADGDDHRELIRLVYGEERPLSDVARLLGIPVGTVKSRLFAVRRRLRGALRGEESLPDV